jgi:hypothetical protein
MTALHRDRVGIADTLGLKAVALSVATVVSKAARWLRVFGVVRVFTCPNPPPAYSVVPERTRLKTVALSPGCLKLRLGSKGVALSVATVVSKAARP